MKIKYIILLGCIFLFGCAANQKFDCPFSEGVRCQRLSTIDKEVDSGAFKLDKPMQGIKFQERKKVKQISFSKHRNLRLRTQEEVIQIWGAPYQSAGGVYHHAFLIDAVLKPADCLGTVHEISAN